ncbi:MarR family winged helix-turn-helix transcriptional regulator [Streptomyces sp. NBC_01591]|uniref:MarR family winged helix-turn-helix transcriptional regulator n=1 Tax=Streptomyces sp. NBC_01591 TaxID=2975888 RepID=UPI002DD8827F|nr:MarR family winged helix-turn-helix transcriptional regulator [Streptomyces sp. NBC_01591]WSD68067.1 MarR family winged helix-turn-helix transcriptional regulator [Streptomyces sp. NBC_01591]
MAERRVEASGRDAAGFELPMLLFAGFRSIIDELHCELAEHGHVDVRPAYGYALQAVGRDGATASEIGRRLGVSKQAAGKTVERLEVLGYVERVDDPRDGRRKLVRLTARGVDVLVRSAEGFERLRARWVEVLGVDRVRAMEADLRTMVPASALRLDVPGWFND